MKTIAAALVLLVAASGAEACSPGPTTARPWMRDPNAPRSHLTLPIVSATAELLHRPPIRQAGEPIGCDQFARFLIRFRVDQNSALPLTNFGYLFRIRGKNELLITLPDYPIQAKVVNGVAELVIEVMDVGEDQGVPINVEVEVQAVDQRLHRGPSSSFRIQADVASSKLGV